MFRMYKKYFFLLFLSLGTLSLAGCGLKPPAPENYQVSLEIWGVFDDSDAYDKIFSQYRALNSHVKSIQYRKLTPETYKEDLINALASGKGPDILMMRNSWRLAFEDKTAPAPTVLLTEKEYRDALVDVAANDFIGTENKIYGIPTSVDSLALYYNKDLFNIAGISEPPTTWDEVAKVAKKLNTIDQFGTITRSGIALGTGLNINRSSDILAVMMMQLGSDINTPRNNQVGFSDSESADALDFYSQFAHVGSPTYSWNAREHYSIDAFYEGTLAMMVNYSWQYETIKQKNAKLNIGVAPLPQFDASKPANLANYWGYAVAKNKAAPTPKPNAAPVDLVKQNDLRIFESWQFLKYLALAGKDKKITFYNALSQVGKDFTLNGDPTKEYLEATHKPAARRDLLTEQQKDVALSPFAFGNLIAKNWYQGDPEAVDGIFIDMIDSVNRGEKKIQDALSVAAQRINILKK